MGGEGEGGIGEIPLLPEAEIFCAREQNVVRLGCGAQPDDQIAQRGLGHGGAAGGGTGRTAANAPRAWSMRAVGNFATP